MSWREYRSATPDILPDRIPSRRIADFIFGAPASDSFRVAAHLGRTRRLEVGTGYALKVAVPNAV